MSGGCLGLSASGGVCARVRSEGGERGGGITSRTRAARPRRADDTHTANDNTGRLSEKCRVERHDTAEERAPQTKTPQFWYDAPSEISSIVSEECDGRPSHANAHTLQSSHRLHRAVRVHDVGDAQEGGDVGPRVEVAAHVVLDGGLGDVDVDACRDVVDGFDEVRVGQLVRRERAADVGPRGERRLVRRVRDAELLERADGRRRARRVRRVHDELAASVGEDLRVGLVNLRRGRGGEDDVDVVDGIEDVRRHFVVPRRRRGDDVPADPRAALLLDLVQFRELGFREAVGLVDEARRIRERHGERADADQSIRNRQSDLPRARDEAAFAFQSLPAVREDVLREVDDAVAVRLGVRHGAAPQQPAAVTREVGRRAFVVPVQVPDFSSADGFADRRQVRAGADVLGELAHERLAEPLDLALGGPRRIEVRAAGRAAESRARQSVREVRRERHRLEVVRRDVAAEVERPLVRAERR
mmetsp:Transcript_3841/g.15212  ORF Transcript_3841/g.15212 Transcript_3841/m.15212 type:complete len:473 (-) Transcript_3841:596-2014(-)